MELQNTVKEFYYSRGRFPESNEEIGLCSAESYQYYALRSMALGKGGVITLSFDARLGNKKGRVILKPIDISAGIIDWKCSTPDYPNISDWLKDLVRSYPKCTYTNS